MAVSSRPHCVGCGYDLTGASTNSCPECGAKFHVKVYGELAKQPGRVLRVAALLAAIATLLWSASEISFGSLMFWWSLSAACIVWAGTLFIVAAVFGFGAIATAARLIFSRVADPAAIAEVAAFFRFTGGVSLGMGALGVTLGMVHYFSIIRIADVGQKGHTLGEVAMCQLYALLIAIPTFVVSAHMSRRADRAQAPTTNLTRDTNGTMALSGVVAAAAALVALMVTHYTSLLLPAP